MQDGTEVGVTEGTDDTDPKVFVPDADPTTTTDPLDADTDDGGVPDGGPEGEDVNGNGAIEALVVDVLHGDDVGASLQST